MLTELQRKDVWEGWLGAEVRANYFADLGQHYRHFQQVLTWAVLVLSSSAAIALMADWLPGWVRSVLAFLTAGVSLWLLVANYPRSATECSDLHFRWSTLATEYQMLWDDMYDPDARTRLTQLKAREAEASKTGTALPNDERRMLRWEEHVIRHRAPAAA